MNINTTPPPVGTTMRWHDFDAEVVLSAHEYMVARDRVGGLFHALHHVDGEWRDNDGDVWEIATPGPPTLPVGTVIQHEGWQDREVVHSAPGYCLVKGPARLSPFAWLDGAWRMSEGGTAWKVRP
jgi:hypothetical protein